MNKFYNLVLSAATCLCTLIHAQPITGIINSYAAVTSISGAAIGVLPVTAAANFVPGESALIIQMKGASVVQTNTVSFGDITSMGGAGTYEFVTVTSVSGSVVTVNFPLTHTYNVSTGVVQLVRVPRFCTPTVNGTLTCAPWNSSTGGILAFEAGTLTLNGDMDVSAKGSNGGNLMSGSYNCYNWNYAAAAGTTGGQKGESISVYITGLNGLHGKQANGGGASNAGNSGGGGGGNGGEGGMGGDLYNNCDTIYDVRGVGGLSLTPAFSTLFMGGGGGGGFKDNGLVATKGGNGGGIVYIRANMIIANNHTISSNGENVTIVADAEGAGGGGAGGSIFIECSNISGNLSVNANGGFGGSSNNSIFVSDCHGTGGGGGGGVFAYSYASLPANITYSVAGGAAGLINNPSSSCFGTTHGATTGSNGISLPGLPATTLALTVPTLNLSQTSAVICSGESETITVSGASSYSWSTGSTSAAVVVSPTVTSSYTVSGLGAGFNSCRTTSTATVDVSPCTGINGFILNGSRVLIYPNPVKDKLFIETGAALMVRLFSQTGQTLAEYKIDPGAQAIDLGNYAAGIYFVKVTGDNESRLVKLVKTE